MGGVVHKQKEGAIGWIVFDQPERRNAVSVEMWQQIPGIIEDLAADDEVRVVVLRGAGEAAFVAGADISQFERSRTGAAVAEYDDVGGRAYRALSSLEKPVIAQIQGYCIGGGVAIALTADLRYASEDAVFAIPAARLGLGYGMGGFESLVQAVGLANAKEIFFTARRFTAHEALRKGLVNAVVPHSELEATVRDAADRIAANAPLTVRSLKLISREVMKEPTRRDHERVADSVRTCFESEDYREGVRAFMEKRPPVFRGR